jgi:MFS family permease
MVIAATFAPTYAGFTAARTLQGFFNTAPQVIGLTIIHDIFFFHERARKINLWAFTFLVGPYLGPLIAGQLISKISWRQDFGVLAAFYGFSTLLIVFLGEETLYDRDSQVQAPKQKGILHKIKLLTGYAGWRTSGRPTLAKIFRHVLAISWLPYLLLPCKCRVCPSWTVC